MTKRRLAAVLVTATLPLSGCLSYTPWYPCPAEKPTYDLTDHTMSEYNAQRPVGVALPYPDGWHHSKWTERRIVTCGSDSAYVRALGAHYRADGSEISPIDFGYTIARRDDQWVIATRERGAP